MGIEKRARTWINYCDLIDICRLRTYKNRYMKLPCPFISISFFALYHEVRPYYHYYYHHHHHSAAIIPTTITTVCQTASYMSVCIRKVLGRAIPTRGFLVFLWRQANAEMVPKSPSCYFRLLTQPSRFKFTKMYLLV